LGRRIRRGTKNVSSYGGLAGAELFFTRPLNFGVETHMEDLVGVALRINVNKHKK
jgi:hypothetical protein